MSRAFTSCPPNRGKAIPVSVAGGILFGVKIITAILFITLLALVQNGQAQGFVNLDFEDANNLGTPGSFEQLSAADAFPGWTVSAPYIVYDDISLSGGSISICDSGPPIYYPPIQGTYFVLLEGAQVQAYGSISIGQTGQVPPSSKSITFWGNDDGMQITFNGQPLSFSTIGSTANYSIYGADISAFAGQTGQLLFTIAPFTGSGMLDNIQFSSSSVPEPSELALGALGALLLGFRRWLNYFQ